MNTSHKSFDRSLGEAGFVSIVVSLIIGVVLSLITIGFAQLMTREQKDVTERQLSTQAFYAAESGVNDTALAIRSNPNLKIDTCPATPTSIDPVGPVEVSCVLVNTEPYELRFDALPTDASKPKVFPINTPSKPDKITIQWSGSAGATYRASGTDLPPITGWTANTGMLKVMFVPFTPSSREALLEAAAVVYLNPLDSGGAGSATTVRYDFIKGLAGQGSIQNANCGTVTLCSVTIEGIVPADEYFMVISSVYRPNNVVVSSVDSTGSRLTMKGVQTVIDSTGRVNETLRRIQVRKPVRDEYLYSGGAIDSPGAICKLIVTSPEETTDACGL